MLAPLLTDAQSNLLRQEKESLAEIRLALAELDVPRASLETLEQATLQLDELFLIVVVGEFNAGKSALVNALLGEKVLAEGVTPTTSRVTLTKWGDRVEERIVDENYAVLSYPLPLLRQVNIVDTPGTNAVIRHHERLTEEFVPRSDLVLFVTSADRPITESERAFLERIRAWGKKVIVALNKVDILPDEASFNEVRNFVLTHVQQELGLTPELFPVSARMAQQARTDPNLRKASGIDALADYIHKTLDNRESLQLKFLNPLGVAEHIIEQEQGVAEEHSQALSQDRETVTSLNALVEGYERDLQSELEPRLAEVDVVLARMQERGLDFFDSTIRLTNIGTLARGDQVRHQFEAKVLDDVPDQIQDRVHRLIDWLVDKDLREWQQVMAFLQKRRAGLGDAAPTESIARFDTRRRVLIDSVGKTASTIVETYNRDEEARELAQTVESAVAQVALLGAGAVGLGALVVALITSSAADITGLLAAGTLAIVGIFIIPYKRNQAKTRFREKTQALRDKLMESLRQQFTNEAENVITRMKEAVAPYTRFIRAEYERNEKTKSTLVDQRQRVSALRGQVSGAIVQKSDGAMVG